MKRFSGIAFLVTFVSFGAGLMTWLVSQEPVVVVYQSSRSAIVNIDTPMMQEAFEHGRIRIESDHPNPQTLFLVNTGNPSQIHGRLDSEGALLVINPRGVLVGEGARIDVGGGLEAGSPYALEVLGEQLKLSAEDNSDSPRPLP